MCQRLDTLDGRRNLDVVFQVLQHNVARQLGMCSQQPLALVPDVAAHVHKDLVIQADRLREFNDAQPVRVSRHSHEPLEALEHARFGLEVGVQLQVHVVGLLEDGAAARVSLEVLELALRQPDGELVRRFVAHGAEELHAAFEGVVGQDLGCLVGGVGLLACLGDVVVGCKVARDAGEELGAGAAGLGQLFRGQWLCGGG